MAMHRLLPRFCDIAVDDDYVYAVDAKDQCVYKRPLLTDDSEVSWQCAARGYVSALAFYDGVLYGVGRDGRVYKQEVQYMTSLSPWILAARGTVVNISVSDGVLYAVGSNNCVYRQYLASMTERTRWNQVEISASVKLSGIASHADGIFGICCKSWRICMHTLSSTSDDSNWTWPSTGYALAIAIHLDMIYVMGREPDFGLFRKPLSQLGQKWELLFRLPVASEPHDPHDPTVLWQRIQAEEVLTEPVVLRYREPSDDYVRLVCISDTHGSHSKLDQCLLTGDILVHAGDLTHGGSLGEVGNIATFFKNLLERGVVRCIVAIAGNHDGVLQSSTSLEESIEARSLLRSHPACYYLQDEHAEVLGVSFFGTPWQPEYEGHADWCKAFTLPRGAEMQNKWMAIPSEVDILVVHGPALGHMDRVHDGRRAGCYELLKVVKALKPRIVVSGHIHEDHGRCVNSSTLFINASSRRSGESRLNYPIIVDLPKNRELPAQCLECPKF